MAFIKYPSIESGANAKYIKKHDKIFTGQFVATEKVHGANFQFICNYDQTETDRIEIKCAKRSDFLQHDEKFYDWKNVLERYRADLESISKLLLNDESKSVSICGELCGGSYPGEESKEFKIDDIESEDYKPVQKGIWYCPYVDFLVFDIIVTKTNNERYFLAYTDVLKCVEKTKLRALPILFSGEFQDCLDFCNNNVDFISKVPRLYGAMSELKDNYAEGYVMKTSGTVRPFERAVLKIKSPRFPEQIGQIKKFKKSSDQINLMDQMIRYHKEAMTNFLTQTRLDGVVSKYGPSTPKIKLIGCFISDAKEDYLKTFEEDDYDHDHDDDCESEDRESMSLAERLKQFNELWKRLYKEMIPLCSEFIYPTSV
jgi:Rnl2 family RNA ligase